MKTKHFLALARCDTHQWIIATAKEDNHPSHAIFKRFGFTRLDKAYSSLRGDYQLGLFAQS